MPAAKTKSRRSGYTADIRHPVTDKRRRVKCETSAEALTLRTAERYRRDQLIEVVGDTTFKQAAENLGKELLEAGQFGVATKLRCHMRHMAPVLKNRKLRLQNKKSIGEIANKLRSQYSGRSESYYKAGLDFLCRIIRVGFKHLKPPVYYKSDIPGLNFARAPYASLGPQYNDRAIPKGDQVKIRLNKATGGLRILLHLLVLLGLRIGEALALRRGDIERDGKGRYWLYVRLSQRENGSLKGTKSPAGRRRIPLNSRMQKLLLDWLAATQGNAQDQLISGMPGVRFLYRDVVKMHKAFQVGLGGPIFTFHRYRAACVTTWLIAGVRLFSVMKWIGHADLRMTVQVYASSIIMAEAVWSLRNPDSDGSQIPQNGAKTALDEMETSANDDEQFLDMQKVATYSGRAGARSDRPRDIGTAPATHISENPVQARRFPLQVCFGGAKGQS